MDVKINLSSTEHKELISFCNLNDLLVSETVKKSYMNGFNIERFGLLNSGQETIEKEVIKEVIKYVEVPVVEEKEVIKIEYIEVPVDKIVEVVKYVDVPVEIIKEVIVIQEVEKEVIKEVPVEIIKEKVLNVIQEVPVEKIVYITDHEEMRTKIFQKEQDFEKQIQNFSTKTQEMENIFQNEKNELLLKIQQLENTLPETIEIIKEVRVEVPVEVIVEKENNDSSLKPKFDALQNTVQKLRQEILDKDKLIKEYQNTIDDIQKYQGETKAVYLKGSNLDNKLYK